MSNECVLVSIILPNYNHFLFLKERIETILNQTFQNFELIILDDFSTDKSKDYLLQYKSHPKVTNFILNSTNSGNTFLQWDKGINMAKGKYIWIAESDDKADLHFLEETVNALENNPTASMCLTGSILINKNSERITNKKTRDRWKENGETKIFNGQKYIYHNLLYRNNVYNASMVVFKKDIYSNLNKSYQKLRSSGDWQFWIEVAKTGDVIEIRKKLNFFRQHTNKVSNKAAISGNGISDNISVYSYILNNFKLSSYKRCMIKGECYKYIKKASKEKRKILLDKAKKLINIQIHHYIFSQINKFFSLFIPFLSTYRRDKYS